MVVWERLAIEDDQYIFIIRDYCLCLCSYDVHIMLIYFVLFINNTKSNLSVSKVIKQKLKKMV